MSRDPRFLEAWVNRTDHRVFGRRLHPLCLLDLVALEAVDSPFLRENAAASRYDFWQAAEILSRPIVTLEIEARIRPPNWLERFSLYRVDLTAENTKLRAYFDDYWSTFEMWRAEGDLSRCNAPWALSQATFLLAHTNLSEWRVWTAPIGQVLCYAAALEEQLSDKSHIVSTAELAQMEAMSRGEG